MSAAQNVNLLNIKKSSIKSFTVEIEKYFVCCFYIPTWKKHALFKNEGKINATGSSFLELKALGGKH